jgi:hypothetical protein
MLKDRRRPKNPTKRRVLLLGLQRRRDSAKGIPSGEPPGPVKGLRFLPKASLRGKTGVFPKGMFMVKLSVV